MVGWATGNLRFIAFSIGRFTVINIGEYTIFVNMEVLRQENMVYPIGLRRTSWTECIISTVGDVFVISDAIRVGHNARVVNQLERFVVLIDVEVARQHSRQLLRILCHPLQDQLGTF